MARPRSAKGRAREVVSVLTEEYPDARCSLDFATPFQLLVATILSAQCTDERVNKITPGLFARFPDAAVMAGARHEELEELIRAAGFFRNKARSIIGMSKLVCERHGGELPRSMDELVKLPGVGRKTANVVLGSAFSALPQEGIAVDTHVERLSRRIGLSEASTPEKIERDLMALVPRSGWGQLPHLLIAHGRRVCKARSPLCGGCALAHFCPSAGQPAGAR